MLLLQGTSHRCMNLNCGVEKEQELSCSIRSSTFLPWHREVSFPQVFWERGLRSGALYAIPEDMCISHLLPWAS